MTMRLSCFGRDDSMSGLSDFAQDDESKRRHEVSPMSTTEISSTNVLSADEQRKMDAYWRACNYLCVGMLYLLENPLLREPLKKEHIKNRLLGHWGSDPGQTFVWVHLNRLIKKYDL